MSSTEPISLGEGNTPLLRSRRIGATERLPNLFFKLESTNPTGSYKDRFASAALTKLVRDGAPMCIGTSSGNTGAALAAYSAAAGMPCVLAIVEDAPEAKLRQMSAYGATLARIHRFGLDATVTREVMQRLQELTSRLNTDVQISAYRYAPIGMAGVESIAVEIEEWLVSTDASVSRAHVFVPAGGGGLALAMVRGFSADAPHVHVVQPRGNDTMASRLRDGFLDAEACVCTTRVSGLQVPSVIDGNQTIAACRATGGSGFVVSDEDIFEMQRRLAREEGIYAEPAGAVAVAGAVQAAHSGKLDRDADIVCLVTGSGFKDDRFGTSERTVSGGRGAKADVLRAGDFDAFERIVLKVN